MPRPTFVSSGLICLDAIASNNNQPHKLFAGGSALNPAIFLSLYGWQTLPIGQIGCDRAGNYLMQDLSIWPVETRFILRETEIQTPIYIEIINEQGHQFLKHDADGKPFPTFEPISPKRMDFIIDQLPETIHVCLVERVSEATLQLIQSCRQRGALIYLELNRIDDPKLFQQCLALSDVFKYSHEKMGDIDNLTNQVHLPLEIKTLGGKGLQYRYTKEKKQSPWKHIPPAPCSHFLDAAGSGDCFTAAILHSFGRYGRQRFLHTNPSEMEIAFQAGQKAAARNCAYEGPRGLLYLNRPILQANDFYV